MKEWMQGEGGTGEIEGGLGSDETEALSAQSRDSETGNGVWKLAYFFI